MALRVYIFFKKKAADLICVSRNTTIYTFRLFKLSSIIIKAKGVIIVDAMMILFWDGAITIFIFSLLTKNSASIVVGYAPSKYPTMGPTNFPGMKPTVNPTTFYPWGTCISAACTSTQQTCCGNSTVAYCYTGVNDVCCNYEFACPSSYPVCCTNGCCQSGYICC